MTTDSETIAALERRIDIFRRERNEILIPRIKELEQQLKQAEDALGKSNEALGKSNHDIRTIRTLFEAVFDIGELASTALEAVGDIEAE